MKKYLLTIIPLILLAGIVYAAPNNLWEYFSSQGKVFPSFSERTKLAESIGINDYKGTATQNGDILAFLMGIEGEPVFGTESNMLIAGSTYNLAGSGITGSATSITLQSFTLPQTGQKIADADLADVFYITLEPGNRSRQEIASCTTVTQNSGGTATLSGCSRGLSPLSDYTASTTLQFSHAGGSQVIFSDPPQVFNTYIGKYASSTVTGLITYATSTTGMFSAGDGVYWRMGDGSENITNKCFYINNGDATPPKMCYNDSTNKWLIYNNGVNSYDITSGGSGLTADVPIYLSSSVIKIATGTDNFSFTLDTSNGNPPQLRIATTTNSVVDMFWKTSYNATTTKGLNFTFSDNLTVLGSATTTGVHNVGEMGFDGGDVISKWPVLNAYASSSDLKLSTTRYYWQSYTSPALGVYDGLHVYGSIFINGDGSNCPVFYIRANSVTTTINGTNVALMGPTTASGMTSYTYDYTLLNSGSVSSNTITSATSSIGIAASNVWNNTGFTSTSTVSTGSNVLIDLSSTVGGTSCYIFKNTFFVDVLRNQFHP